MKLKCFLQPLYFLYEKFLKSYFTQNYIIKGFFIAFLLSNFIFFAIFENKTLNFISSLSAIFGLYLILTQKRQIWFWSGFFIGILWFYWISFSLIYYDFWFLIPIEILAIGLIYGFIFLAFGYFENAFLKAFFLVVLGYFYPFNFNWLNLELIFVNTPINANFITLSLVLFSLIIIKKYKIIGLLCLFCFIVLNSNFNEKSLNFPQNIEIVNTKIPQSKKWERDFLKVQINENLEHIKNAIKNKKEIVILPETTFPMFLEKSPNLINYLKDLSQEITIVTGSLSQKDKKTRNSIYIFQKGELEIFDKFILVPFGEEIPLPKFFTDLINGLFFSGNSDFDKAKTYSEVVLNDTKFRLAICYEITRAELYENSPKFLIAISNNGWFVPSTQPTLQKILIKYYAKKHNSIIYHSINGSKGEIITP